MEKEKFNDENNHTINEEKILLDIYNNMLYPPPIGKYSKNLNFDSTLNMNSLIPITLKNENIMLGEGAFSKVQLYQHKTTKIKYAVKKMNLIQLEKLSQNKKFVLNEMSIQGRINHPNIIKLFNFYEIKKNYILILEYASKGTLFDLINSKNGLSESIAFYYFIQTLNAIYFLHLHSIIHRDLKPENLLINENNILKLCDFGWSVKLKSDKRTTFCGTVEYMAPEIIKKQQYDETIDVWSLGVLLYELVHSYSPFCSEDCDYRKIGNNIIQSEFEFKEGLSEDYKDLIQKILIKDSEKRIKIEEIYQHPFITKHINTIYREINSFNNTYNNTLIDYNNLNSKLNGKTAIKDLKNKSIMNYMNTEYNNIVINKKKTGDIIYNRIEKNKNSGCFYKKNSPKINNTKDQSNDYKIKYKDYDISRQQDNDFENNTDTNYIFESIPTEPEPKILPDSKKCKEIKKVNNDIFIKKNENNSPNIKKGENNLLLLNTSKNKKQINSIKKENKIKNLFKIQNQNQNKISHVKSFSLEQNNLNQSQLKDNKLKIIIRINNTQNRNFIDKNKKENLSTKNKKIINNYFEDKYEHYPPKKNKKVSPKSKMNANNNRNNYTTNDNKAINQILLGDMKNTSNNITLPNNNNKNIIKYKKLDLNESPINYIKQSSKTKNYIKKISYLKKDIIKTENSNCSPYITLANASNGNNSSNIIISNTNKNSPKNILKTKNGLELKKIIRNYKIPNSNNNNSKFIRRINSESNCNISANNINNNSSREINGKVRSIDHPQNSSKFNELKQLSIVNIHKNTKSSIIQKIVVKNVKSDLNNTINISNGNKQRTENNNNNHQNLTQNINLTMINQNIINNNIHGGNINNDNSNIIKKYNSYNKNKKLITFSRSNKTMIQTFTHDNNKGTGNISKDKISHKKKSIKKVCSELKLKPKEYHKILQNNKKMIKIELNA